MLLQWKREINHSGVILFSTLNSNSKIPNNSILVVTGKAAIPEHRTGGKGTSWTARRAEDQHANPTCQASLFLSNTTCSSAEHNTAAPQRKELQEYERSGKEGRVPLHAKRQNSVWSEGKISIPPVRASGKGKARSSSLGRARREWTAIPASLALPRDAQTPQDHGCSSEGRQQSPPGCFPELQEKLIHCWSPPSTSRLCKDAANLQLAQELQAPALKCSVEFLQTLHIWSIRDGIHVRKASDNQIAELCHAPDDLTGLFNTSPKHKAIKSAFPPKSCPGRGMALTSKAGVDTGRTKWDQNKYYNVSFRKFFTLLDKSYLQLIRL